MSWGSGPPTVVVGDVIAAATGNLYRDLFLETAPAKATAAGQLFVATGAGALAALPVGSTGQVLQVSGGTPAWAGFVGCSLGVSSTTGLIPNNALTAVGFDQEIFDTDAMHDNVTNNERITIKTAGTYLFTATLEFAGHATGARTLRLWLQRAGGSDYCEATVPVSSASYRTSLTLAHVAAMAVNDYAFLRALQDSGGNLAFNVVDLTTFCAARLGP